MIPIPGQEAVAVPYDDLVLWEAEGRTTYSVRIFDGIVDLNINAVLNGIDLEDVRRSNPKGDKMRPARLFYSYSHKDETLRSELETHLKILHRRGLIEPWHDRNIDAGEEWKSKINDHLKSADIILLLVSSDFIASDYCYEIEMKTALKKHADGESKVIPIIIRDVNWKSAPFAKLQALPIDAKPVTEWATRDAAWRNVSDGVERALAGLEKAGRL
jgi:internalin A